MNQRKKNTRLLIILAVLTVLTAVVWITGGESDTLQVRRDLFSYENTEAVDMIVVGRDTLQYINGQWMVNGTYKADPQRVQVLFAIAKQVQVRRKASKTQIDSLNQLFNEGGIGVSLYTEGTLVKDYEVLGDESRGMTWMRTEEEQVPYLIGIPGYRSYLGGIFALDENSWRYPIVYDLNWQNLQGVRVVYPEREDASFNISFTGSFYEVEGLPGTDSTRLTDFLDNLSLLYVNDYLFREELKDYDSLMDDVQAHIVVEDVGQNEFVLDIYEKVPGRDEILIRKDSSEYGLANYQKVKTLLKPRSFFRVE